MPETTPHRAPTRVRFTQPRERGVAYFGDLDGAQHGSVLVRNVTAVYRGEPIHCPAVLRVDVARCRVARDPDGVHISHTLATALRRHLNAEIRALESAIKCADEHHAGTATLEADQHRLEQLRDELSITAGISFDRRECAA